MGDERGGSPVHAHVASDHGIVVPDHRIAVQCDPGFGRRGCGAGRPRSAHGTHWYIARIDIAGVFGDSLAAFIDECAASSHLPASAQPTAGHVRAWLVTGGVAMLDLLLLGYLVSRRPRQVETAGYVQWWEEPLLDVEDDSNRHG